MASPVSPMSESHSAQHVSSLPPDRRPSANLPEVVPESTLETHRSSDHVYISETVPPYGDAEAFDLQHRLSQKGRNPRKPSAPGLESVWAGESAKEVYTPTVVTTEESTFEHSQSATPSREHRQKGDYEYPPGVLGYRGYEDNNEREYCGLRKKWFFGLVALAVLVILAIALGVGLGVGLSQNKSSSNSQPGNIEYLIGGAISPKYFSTTGAFNGSGIALASQSFSSSASDGTQGSIVMYFQHWTGEIRWMELSDNGNWVGGTASEVVAVDAKNSTPLSAVSYSVNGTDTWHIFYIDQDNVIKQRSNSNTTLVWVDGEINNAHLVANDADQVGMQACWYGSDYGDSNYNHTPLPGGTGNYSKHYGMRIWYASDDTTFKQLGWRYGDSSWEEESEFSNLNGHAGVGCYSWGPGTVTYVMFVNTNNEVEFYWRDTNTSLPSTASHPINKWTKAPISIPGVDPSTSLGYTNYFYAQIEDTHLMKGYNITWGAENTKFAPNGDFTVAGEPGVPGTHMSVSAIPNAGGGNSIIVFYQALGNDITEYTRDLIAGQWSSVDIVIPTK